MRQRHLIAIGTLATLLGCSAADTPIPCAKVLAVSEQHATRVTVRYEEITGEEQSISVHQSQVFVCGDTTVYPRAYLSLYGGTTPYGAFRQRTP